MNPIKRFSAFLIVGMLMVLLGCSQGGSPVAPSNSLEPLETMPLTIAEQAGMNESLGVMGAYHLSINQADMSAELTPMRISTIGESYIVSGIGFFTVAPCADCLSLSGFTFTGGKVGLLFKIRHPFDRGVPTLPPTAKNRLDLDVFDLAMVIVPTLGSPTNFPGIGVDIFADVVANAAGYTRELANLIDNDAAVPYVLVVDNSQSDPPSTWNKFAMGAESFFDVFFSLTPGLPLSFDMYLTMGYGASAKRAQRLEPKYYNPEFNRKAAWKVEVATYGPWLDTPVGPTTVEVMVYDWQIGATVYSGTDFENAPKDNIYAASGVDYVKVEIPGMAPVMQVDTPTSGSGSPYDPLIYEVPILNSGMLSAGLYTGLVQVMDERKPLTPAQNRDYLIDSPNGIDLSNYVIPEFATYQTFPVEVVHEGITLYQNDYNLDGAIINNSDTGSVLVGYPCPVVPQYFNLNIMGEWIIQNAPILPTGDAGVPQAVSIDFPLRFPIGMDVTSLDAGWSLTESPSMVPPPLEPLIPVYNRDITIYSGEIDCETTYKQPHELYCVPVTDFAVKPRLPNQDVGTDECVPGAISNSLKMLQDESGKPPAGTDISTDGMKGPTGWTAPQKDAAGNPIPGTGGCPWPGWANGKKNWGDANGITTEVIQNPTAADLQHALDELKRCQDVEIRTPGHVAAVKGIAKCADGSYIIAVNHDTDQKNAGGTDTELIGYDPNAVPPTFNGGTWFNGGTLGGIVIECPKP